MTGFKSKKAAAQDKLEQWDNGAFNAWWDSDYDDSTNPYEINTFAYWAWAGWQAAQQAQEPFGYLSIGGNPIFQKEKPEIGRWETLYTAPPQRPWVGLTDEQIDVIYEQHHNQYGECESPNFGYERAILKKSKEKNT
jgi:hypothetical protein